MLFLRYSADKLFANFGLFLFLYPVFGSTNQNNQKMKKKQKKKHPKRIIILHTLRCLINTGVKINVEVRDFS